MVTPATFTGLEIIAAVAFAVPLALDLLHLRLLPAVVFEVLAGIIIGPYGLGWVSADEPVQIFSLIGLGFLLFLAGMEVDVARFRGTSTWHSSLLEARSLWRCSSVSSSMPWDLSGRHSFSGISSWQHLLA